MSDHTYSRLADAEQALKEASFGVGAIKLEAVKVLVAIRERELWRDEPSPVSGAAYRSLDEYLRTQNETLKRYAGMGSRQALRHLKAYLCFCDALGFADDWLLQMGEHALILSEAANTERDLILREEDRATKDGGTYLGLSHLREQALEIAAHVAEGDWKVKDTKTLVGDILGKATASTGEWLATVREEGASIVIERLTWVCDGRLREFANDERWTREDFLYFAEKEKVKVHGLDLLDSATHLH